MLLEGQSSIKNPSQIWLYSKHGNRKIAIVMNIFKIPIWKKQPKKQKKQKNWNGIFYLKIFFTK
jgi:hypothetical protein